MSSSAAAAAKGKAKAKAGKKAKYTEFDIVAAGPGDGTRMHIGRFLLPVQRNGGPSAPAASSSSAAGAAAASASASDPQFHISASRTRMLPPKPPALPDKAPRENSQYARRLQYNPSLVGRRADREKRRFPGHEKVNSGNGKWALQDQKSGKIFEGAPEKNANYILLRMDASSGRLTSFPVDFYRFTRRIEYRTLDSDEAEKKMKTRPKGRWETLQAKEKERAATGGGLAGDEFAKQVEEGGGDADERGEGLDYDDTVDDDEMQDGDQPEAANDLPGDSGSDDDGEHAGEDEEEPLESVLSKKKGDDEDDDEEDGAESSSDDEPVDPERQLRLLMRKANKDKKLAGKRRRGGGGGDDDNEEDEEDDLSDSDMSDSDLSASDSDEDMDEDDEEDDEDEEDEPAAKRARTGADSAILQESDVLGMFGADGSVPWLKLKEGLTPKLAQHQGNNRLLLDLLKRVAVMKKDEAGNRVLHLK